MNKKIFLFILLFFMFSFTYSDDVKDMQYIYRLHKDKLHKEAVLELETFVKKYPDSKLYETALNLLATNYYITENYHLSEITFKKLLNSSFRNEAYYYLALIYVKKNELKQAEEYADYVSDNTPLRNRIIFIIGNEYFKDKYYIEAEKNYNKLFKRDNPYYISVNLKLGIIAYYKKEYMKSAAYLEEYLFRNASEKQNDKENHSIVYYILADINTELRDKNNALKYYLIIENEYSDTQYYNISLFNIFKTYLERKDNNNILTYLSKLKTSEYYNRALIMTADYKYDNFEYSESEKYYKESIAISDDEYVNYKLLLSMIKQSKFSEAVNVSKKLKNTKYNDEYYYYYSFLLHKEKMYKDVIKELKDVDKEVLKKEYIKDIYTVVGESAYIEKEYDISENYYKKLYEMEKNIKDIYRLVVIAYNKKDAKKTESYYEEYVRTFSNDEEYKRDIYNMAGNSYFDNKQYEKAEKTFKTYLEYKNDKIILNNLIAVLLKSEKYKDASVYLEKAEKTSENIFLKAEVYVKLKEYTKAAKEYNNIIDSGNDEYMEKAYQGLVDVSYITADYKNTIKYGEMYIRRNYTQYKYDILEKKAISYFKTGEYEKSIWDFEALQSYTPKKDFAVYMLAEVYYNQSKFDKSKEYYEKIVLDFPNSIYRKRSLYWLININYNTQNYDSALNYIEFFLKTYKDNEYLHDITYFLANIHYIKNNLEQAVNEYEKLLELTKDEDARQKIMETIMQTYAIQHKYQEAMNWIEKMKESSFKTLWIGITSLNLEMNEKAVESFNKIVNDKEVGDKANYYLGNYYFDTKDYEKSEKSYETILNNFTTSEFIDNALLRIGLMYDMKGDYTQAILRYTRIKYFYQESDVYDVAVVKISEAHEKQKEEEKAIENYIFFYENIKQSPYRQIVLERLTVYYINKEKIEDGRKYYNELKIVNANLAKEYENYFK